MLHQIPVTNYESGISCFNKANTINRKFCKCFKTDNKTIPNFLSFKKNEGILQKKWLRWKKRLQKLYAHFANFMYVQNSSPFKSVDYPRLFTLNKSYQAWRSYALLLVENSCLHIKWCTQNEHCSFHPSYVIDIFHHMCKL